MALAATLCTWLATALGAAMVIFVRMPSQRLMNAMMGFSAGVMIAASFWSLLEPAVVRAQAMGKPAWLVASAGFTLGAAFIWAADYIMCIVRGKPAVNSPKRRNAMLLLSITLHNIPEGLAIGVAFGAMSGGITPDALMGALSVAFGIALQNFPEGAAVSLPLRREGVSRFRSFTAGQLSAIVEPVAGVLGALLAVSAAEVLPYALSFAAGAMVLVCVHELIPECQRDRTGGSYTATMGVIAGFAVMMALDVMLG